MKQIIAFILIVFSIGVFTTVIVKQINLKQNCTGYLQRASNANTVETAIQELEKATSYLESNNLTSGYTSILWRTPDEDISFWYNNIKSSLVELNKVDENTTALEKSNLLMKLRETLTDNGKEGDQLIIPDGLSRYPNNGIFSIFMWLSGFIIIGLIVWGSVELNRF